MLLKKGDMVCILCVNFAKTNKSPAISNSNDESVLNNDHDDQIENDNRNDDNDQNDDTDQNDNQNVGDDGDQVDDLYNQQDNDNGVDDQIESRSDSCKIKIQRARINNKTCIVCNASDNKLHRISQFAITDVLIRANILIPFGSRSCSEHFEDFNLNSKLKYSDIAKIAVYADNTDMNSETILDLIQSLRSEISNSNLCNRFDDLNRIDSTKCKKMLGIYFLYD